MAGLRGKSGPPGNMNAFKQGLAAIQKRREETFTQNRIEWRSEQRTSTARGPKSIMSHLRRFSHHQDRIDRRVRYILQDFFEGEISSI
jgi:hypothetical protein